MATVTGMTAAAMEAIRDGTVTGAAFDSTNNLILTKYDGTQINAGALSNATTTQAGSVELATSAETQAGVDTVRAVTPAGLASIPGYKTQILADNALSETADPSLYPYGTSMMSLTTGSGWSINGGFGMVVTQNISVGRTAQTFYENSGGTASTKAWVREYNSAVGGGGWTAWAQVMLMVELNAANFTQTTTRGNYPNGMSRLYYTSATSTGWDFSGSAGEVITYIDGTDFGRQTYTKHVGGSPTNTETWTRTATAAGGWTNWLIVAKDTGWVSLTLSVAAGFSLKRSCFYRIINRVVYLSGAFTAPYSGTGNYTTALTLPSVARPIGDRQFSLSSNTVTTMAANLEYSTGNLGVWTSASTTAWLSLDGISYPLG